MKDDLVPCQTRVVVPLVSVSVPVIEAILEDKVVTEVIIVAELLPHHNIIWFGNGAFICHHQVVVQDRSVIDVSANRA